MKKTTANEIIESFESSFAAGQEIPFALELVWLKKAIGRYGVELGPLAFQEEVLEFDTELDRYTIDCLAEFMKQLFLEREVSLANRRIDMAGRDLAISASGSLKKYTRDELTYVTAKAEKMVQDLKASLSP